jgi:hypothetical protein
VSTARSEYCRSEYAAAVTDAYFWLDVHEACLRAGQSTPRGAVSMIASCLSRLIAEFAKRERLTIDEATEELANDYLAAALTYYATAGCDALLRERLGD